MRKSLQAAQSERSLYFIITSLSTIILLIGCGPSEKDMQRVNEEAMNELRMHGAVLQEKTMAVMNTAKKLSHSRE